MMPISPAAAALNHLLSQNSWALPRLSRHAGKTVRFDIAPFSFVFTIQDDGMLQSASPDASPDATCAIAPSLLPRLALQDEDAYAGVAISGDAGLLSDVFHLSRNLTWDAADDLSRFTGDIAAERIVAAATETHRQMRAAALNLSQAAAEYLTEERPLVAKPRDLSAFAHHVDTLRDDLSRLEQRIMRLASTHKS